MIFFLTFYNSTKKRQRYFDMLKAFSVRHSLEYKKSDSDRKVNRNIYPDAVTIRRILSSVAVSEYIFRLTFRSLSDALYSDESK